MDSLQYKTPEKETHRTRLALGGGLVNYTGTLATSIVTVTTVMCLFNSVVSTSKAKFVMVDINDFRLNNDLPEPEYIKIHISIIPDEICQKCDVQKFINNKG